MAVTDLQLAKARRDEELAMLRQEHRAAIAQAQAHAASGGSATNATYQAETAQRWATVAHLATRIEALEGLSGDDLINAYGGRGNILSFDRDHQGHRYRRRAELG